MPQHAQPQKQLVSINFPKLTLVYSTLGHAIATFAGHAENELRKPY